MANRLAHSSSAYLKSAAHQPIDWYEFGDEAFEQAKTLDRPVLLDIGAVWCHWCHVIDRESYDDPEIAQYINDHYIAVKVDRDQRPDIDARYQQVVSSLSGQGGWPLTGFLTYDGRVIYGGTYFPPQAMRSLLERIKDVYQEKKAEIFQSGEVLTEEMVRTAEASTTPEPLAAPPVSSTVLDAIFQSIRNAFDTVYGGFGSQPKFPHFSTLELLITRTVETDDSFPRQVITQTLDEMAHGGVYDQIAGGFHRYSVDRMWHVPHFEKMAYDNAEALKVYAQAYCLTQKPFYKEVAEGIIGWVNAQLSNQEHGGFFASQDADIDLNDDGDHFTWTINEVRNLLTAEEAEVAIRYYDLTPQGDMHERPSRNVLWVKVTPAQVASQLSLSEDRVQELIQSAKVKMLAERGRRPIPFIDTTLYTNWNGMLLSAYFEAADLLNLPAARAFAQKTLEMMLQRFYQPNKGVLHCDGVEGFLEDYAYFAQSALKGYQSTGEARYLQAAEDMVQYLISHFEDSKQGGFYDTRQTGTALGLLKFQRKPIEDSPSSSANAVILQVLNQLYLITGKEQYREKAERALRFFLAGHGNYGLFISALGIAAHQYLNPPLKVELVGSSQNLQEQARQVFYPGKVIAYNTQEPIEKPEARLCFGQRCLAPVKEGQELSALIETTAHTAK